MNKLNKFSRAILAIVMMLCVALSTLAHDFSVSGIYYNYLDETAKTVEVTYKNSNYDSYSNEYTGRITIPSSVTYSGTTYSVTTIGDDAFHDCYGLTSVTIGNSVTSIGNYAFEGCSGLTSITIPNSVTTIGDYAFYYCNGLTSVTIGNSVTSIGDRAFEGCSGLTELNYNAENCTSMGSSNYPVFGDCSNLKIVNIGSSVKSIPSYAFYGCAGLTTITIPNSVTSIGASAFYNCTGLTSVTIGNSVTQIGSWAFANCGLRLIMSHCVIPPTCADAVFEGANNTDSYRALLMIPEGSLIDYALADEWHKFTQVHEVSEATVSTQEKNATFEIPTIEGATKYDVTVYTDITMTQLVATTHYDATGKIIPMSTTLELSIDGFEDGVYYYKVLVKSADGEVLNNYIGTFEIDAAGVENIATDNAIEVARYDIHGRLLSEPTKGLNIIKMSDGTTRKEIVK